MLGLGPETSRDALAIVRENDPSVEDAGGFCKCQVIRDSMEIAVVYGHLRADCFEEQSFPFHVRSGKSFPSDLVQFLSA